MIDMEAKTIPTFDSLGGNHPVFLQALKQYLVDEHMAKKGIPLPSEDEWKLIVDQPRETPQEQP